MFADAGSAGSADDDNDDDNADSVGRRFPLSHSFSLSEPRVAAVMVVVAVTPLLVAAQGGHTNGSFK